MNWKIKAILQKFLAISRIGDLLNHIPATLNKNYHYNVTLYQTHECIRKFSYCNFKLSEKNIALEIGTGYSLISSIVLHLIGFDKIVSVDVSKDIKLSIIKKQIIFLESDEIIKLFLSKSVYSKTEIIEKINFILKLETLDKVLNFLNIIYIAPYQFNDIQKDNTKFRYISSQVVLEHISPNELEKLFSKTKNWLSKDGFCVHTINFIDHFANPGFFQDKNISEFNFLKYSDRYWKFWSGNSIAYTNRLSYLYYLDLCEKLELNVIDFIGENYRPREELNSKLIHIDILKKYNSDVNIDDITKFQRGTLVIKS